MPKKTGVRSSRDSGASGLAARRNRTARVLPRPSATVPIQSDHSAEIFVAPTAPYTRTPPATRSASQIVRTNRSARGAPLTSDYRYVVRDLKRIGILAAVAFATLAGLTFVVH